MIPIDILDAITFVKNDSDLDQDIIIDNDIDKIISEIQDIINELNLEDPITAKRFVHIDDKIPIESLSEDDIIATIFSSFEKDDNIKEYDKLEIDVISNKEALNSLKKVIQYCKNPPDNVSIDYAELK
ncbi:15811_t:CDS:2, partial [Funneliformis geosporum]